MPLNRLENFIKNIEGRILYVNPNDLDSSDSINNDGNSLAQPFKTIQRALIESARFSYIAGDNNDYIERTTILVYPGEHTIDNRPGFAIKPDPSNATVAQAVAPGGGTTNAQDTFSLTLTSNFDIDQKDNILYKFNSIHGGVIIPRGTSLVGLDLRKTKIRPKYVPNPIDTAVPYSAIFRITGACYFWQFSLFDGNINGTVFTNNISFDGPNDVSTPTFSHNKLTCFEYADGVNKPTGYEITDLDMYYAKLSNAFNASAATKEIPSVSKYPQYPDAFAARRPEFEIVGAFASDPITISDIISGDGSTPSRLITVTTAKAHGLNQGTPIKVKGVANGSNTVIAYNASSAVQEVLSTTQFTYLITGSLTSLPPSTSGTGLNVDNATVTVETDTVEGASPYIFNCSLRSVWGMQGMRADGKKATGFRSMVVAQFTGISLQKDDRAFVKYDKESRVYKGISLSNIVYGSQLAAQSSSLDVNTVYHLDSDAVYRTGWETTHVSITNDAILQVVSVFAIGYNAHFGAVGGGDASITNSNSNFGQLSLTSDGFKAAAFDKDNAALITSIITPKSIVGDEVSIDWFKVDAAKTKVVGINSHLYLNGFIDVNNPPPSLVAGYRIGAAANETLQVPIGVIAAGVTTETAVIRMVDGTGGAVSYGSSISVKKYPVSGAPSSNIFTIGSHELTTGETVRIYSEDADLPENIEEHILYYVIDRADNNTINLASSFTDASNQEAITVYGGSKLVIESRVHDKDSGDIGSPIQFNPNDATFTRDGSSVTETAGWYVNTTPNSSAYANIAAVTTPLPDEGTTNVTFVQRKEDSRSLDEKIYKMRVVVPKEVVNGKNPEDSFIIQDSSSTGARKNSDFTETSITSADWDYDRNPRFISTCTQTSNVVTVLTDLPHDLNVDDRVNIVNVTSSSNTDTGAEDFQNKGFNGTFRVSEIINSKSFKYPTTDIDGVVHSTGTKSTNDVAVRNTSLPRFTINDIGQNYYIYRNETVSPYIEGIQDGIYHVFVLNASNTIPTEYTNYKYSQNVVDLYPQLDRDNNNDNPSATVSAAKRSPIGDVSTNYLKSSLTRETTDKFIKDFGYGPTIKTVTDTGSAATFDFERAHTFNGIVSGTITGGSSYINGTHQNVKLLATNADPTVGTWNGATANVTVTGGAVSAVEIVASGGGYSAASLFFDNTRIGAGSGTARYTIASTGITANVGDVVQVTGIGTRTDGYYRIATVPNDTRITVTKNSSDPVAYAGQYVFDLGPFVTIDGTPSGWDAVKKVLEINTTSAHGLLVGNSFRVIKNSDNSNLGDFLVSEVPDYNTIKAVTTTDIGSDAAGGKLYKLGMAANNALSDKDGENLGVRGISFYGNEYLTLNEDITSDTSFKITSPNSGIGTMSRFPLGSYIQIGSEIMRISSSTLSGSSGDEITVIRGTLGTVKSDHVRYSLIKKIEPIPVEFRRPSILRASGHTFEYVGYGPGNYSTGLPQVQVKTLTQREEFLSQSQERSCGAVIYTGMNNRGDFYIGNKKINSATGEERTFDAPIPTVTGQDPSRLSVIFDEVICKERIIVEGGKSNKILSQFDGPVTFNADIKFNDVVTFNDNVKFNAGTEIPNPVLSGATFTNTVNFKDNVKATFGNSQDLEVFHSKPDANPGKSIVNDAGEGNLEFQSGGTKMMELTSTGIDVSGTFTTSGNAQFGGDVTFAGDSYNAIWDKSTDSLHFNDLAEATFGNTSADPDLEIYANGTNSVIHHTLNSGMLHLKSNKSIDLISSGFTAIRAVGDAVSAATLFFNGNERLTTGTAGVTVTGELGVTGDIIAFQSSDETLKDNIVPIPNALDKVISISGNTFNWNEKSSREGQGDTGVIAQEVEKLDLPNVTTTRDDGTKAVRYEKLIPLLIEAIKELKNEVDELKNSK